jgi:hypothetical protein
MPIGDAIAKAGNMPLGMNFGKGIGLAVSSLDTNRAVP